MILIVGLIRITKINTLLRELRVSIFYHGGHGVRTHGGNGERIYFLEVDYYFKSLYSVIICYMPLIFLQFITYKFKIRHFLTGIFANL